ncbi:hypothetical protein [Alishewanella longhuensis]
MRKIGKSRFHAAHEFKRQCWQYRVSPGLTELADQLEIASKNRTEHHVTTLLAQMQAAIVDSGS